MVQSPHLLSFICRLLIVALAGNQAPTSFFDVTDPNCESAYEGIHYCIEDDGDLHVVAIDLHDPHIRFEMVMADDVTSVETTHRERIEDIVNRQPYEDQDVAVAVNADYFGRRHGPEGLTVKNGRRLDADGDLGQNPNAVWRSSLTISRLNRVTLGRKSAEELEDPRAYRERFYNAVGGGPLILNYGVVIPNTVACLLERFPVGACRRKIQTAAGLSEDGRWLYLAVGEGRDIQGFARLFRDYGAFTALKLDGGGSSQLWYDGEMRHDTDRAVGKKTLAVRLGVKGTQTEYLFLLIGSHLMPPLMWLFNGMTPWVMLTWLSGLLAVSLWQQILHEKGRTLNPALAGTARLELVYGVLLSVGLIVGRFF